MREIKFRAFNTLTGKMIDLYKTTLLALDANLSCDGIFVPFVDEYKIMQFTGVADKNGKEIYEGDILKDGKDENNNIGVVYYYAPQFVVQTLEDVPYALAEG